MALKLGSNDTAILAGSSVVKQILLGSSPKFAAPVLDHVPGAAAAYSLRRLSNAYTGPVVKVRRSSDSTTADFTAAEVVDGTLTAWVGAGDGFVDTWYDQSGNERNATQATAGYQPKVVSSGVLVTEGGKPAIRFDGVNDYLSSLTLASVFSGVNKTTSTFCLGGSDSASTGIFWNAGSSSSNFPLYYVYDSAGSLGAWARNDLNQSTATLSAESSGQTLSSALFLPSNQSFYVNGGFAGSDSFTLGQVTLTEFAIGILVRTTPYSQPLNGTISELIIYPSDVSASRELAEGEIAWHYGLQAKLPYNHAYAPQALGGGSQAVPTDSDVLAFAAASGAKSIPDLNKIEDLVTYLKAQGLWNYARFYPMKSAQNAGTGSTVYGLGGLTSNNMTLVNSPTWGSDGVTFDAASSQHGTASDFLGGGSISAWARLDHTSGNSVLSQYDFGANKRSVDAAFSSGKVVAARSPTGVSPEVYQGDSLVSGENTISIEWVEGAGRNIWINKNVETLALIGGTPQTQRLNTDAPIGLMANFNNGVASNFSSGTVVLAGFIETALTTTQRETITDLINAL